MPFPRAVGWMGCPCVPELQKQKECITVSKRSVHARLVARFLGYCLLGTPNEQGRDALTREIIECTNKQRNWLGSPICTFLG
ncbi:uncharacterized protein EI90DRAFT_443876 [Cantharellus anzutake]|uniref:uncharacterized protein n=1 Tax=Cantharellus anzutake TaxID=1750568 RepID=UPI0019088876|nr:uncharacterized protein EI90DRAFT_443876 [Cantharellus anzutake]KAF8334625.1 hypothetical protein EI90DRAFT_443876 [Cantharellus anzutake]